MSAYSVTGLSKPTRGFAALLSSRGWAVTAICVLLILFVGILDYVTGYEMDFFLFYYPNDFHLVFFYVHLLIFYP